jgi:SAM-dependent methyltransferase
MTADIALRVAPGEVIGVDVDARPLEQARALALSRGIANIRFEVASVYELPFADATFDAVFSNSLTSHLVEPARALAEMRRVLKSAGIAAVLDNDPGTFVVSPDGSAIGTYIDLFVRVQGFNGGNRLLSRDLRGALLAAGFVRAEVYAGGEGFGSPEQTRTTSAALVATLTSAPFRQTVLDQGWATPAELDALPAALLNWGQRPDAFAAVLKCGALGWVGDTP